MYQRASDLGDTDGMFDLALYFEDRDCASQNKSKIIQLLHKVAVFGDTDAMNILAICYNEGYGVSQNKKMAIQLLWRASDLGNAEAMFNLADCYLKGDGVAQDKSKAFQMFQKASDLGNTKAFAELKKLVNINREKQAFEALPEWGESGDEVTKALISLIILISPLTLCSHSSQCVLR